MLNESVKRFNLEYRPWVGAKNPWWYGSFAIARESLLVLGKRKLFWGLYSLAMIAFLFYFFGQYLFFWLAELQSEEMVKIGGFGRANPGDLLQFLRNALKMDGSPETFRNFIAIESRTLILVLIFAGVNLVGDDLTQGTMPFYSSRPKGIIKYLLGKFLAASFLVFLLIPLPSILLFIEICLLDSWDYLFGSFRTLVGILGYSLLINLGLVLPFLVSAALLRGTINIILFWSGVFFLLPALVLVMVETLKFDIAFRMFDYWYCLERLGEKCLGAQPVLVQAGNDKTLSPWLAALMLAGTVSFSLVILKKIYLTGERAFEN